MMARFESANDVMRNPTASALRWAAGIGLLCICMLGAAQSGERLQSASAPDENESRITVQDVKGSVHLPLSADGRKATVFFFLLHDCPISNSYAPEINRIVATYGAKGVRSYIVYVETDLSAREARKHAKDYGFQCPALLDASHTLVNFTQATIAPEVAVLSPKQDVLYRGRIDDRVADFGKRRVEPTQRDLRHALDAIVDGKPVPTPITKAIGCYIPSVKESKTQ